MKKVCGYLYLILTLEVCFDLFVSHLRPMGLNVLGYQSHLLQRCHPAGPACGHEGFSHLSPVLAYDLLSRCKFNTLTPCQAMIFNFAHSRSHAFPYESQKNRQYFKHYNSDLQDYHYTTRATRNFVYNVYRMTFFESLSISLTALQTSEC